MRYSYRTQGTCSQAIEFEIEDGIVKNVQFYGGCNGNTQGVSALVEGMKVPEDALTYYYLVKSILGEQWLNPNLFRVGTSRLAGLILEQL